MSDPYLTPEQAERHIGRSWSGHDLEDACPCEQEPCGLVRLGDATPACTQHPVERAQSIRQGHRPDDCPDQQTAREAAGRRLYDATYVDNPHVDHWRELWPEDRETWVVAAARREVSQ